MSVPTAADRQAAFAATLVDEWVRGGVTHVVVCPGSRSTPLALAVAAEPRLAVHVRLDERSAGFSALGIGLATGRPAVVVVTSGTAAAELHAAVVEADLARVPLVVCTADRPPELRDVGAPQTIDQTHLYGRAARWFADPGVPDEASRAAWRSLGSRAVAEALCGPRGPGPVHLNLPFREPLVGHADAVPDGRPGGVPWHRVAPPVSVPSTELVADLVATGEFVPGSRGIIVAGAGCGEAEAILALAEALWWPVLADPRSGLLRAGPGVVGLADGILRSPSFVAANRPDLVLRLGGGWASKVVNSVLAECPSVVVDPVGWADPEHSADRIIRSDPTALCRALTGAVASHGRSRPDRVAPWPDEWTAAQRRAERTLWSQLGTDPGGDEPELTEPALAFQLFRMAAAGSNLMVSSSMPVRDLESFGAVRDGSLRVMANRGANGIDGVVSTALGVAWADGPTTAFVGDLAFLHDATALVGPAAERPPLTIVVADNGGGGIFSFLPQRAGLPAARFEQLFGTPQGVDPLAVARGFGWDVAEVAGAGWKDALAEALRPADGGRVVVVRLPDRTTNVAAHDRINAAIVDAVDTRQPTPPGRNA